jgi:hypothetical protein
LISRRVAPEEMLRRMPCAVLPRAVPAKMSHLGRAAH